ncbi:MAG TPA: DUF2975 domain-containing protein [Paludibacter sp.]|nr:DUF2975 domain-containing protein [Paludibacter sp.]
MGRLNNLCVVLLVVFLANVYQGAVLPFIHGVRYGLAVSDFQMDNGRETKFFEHLDVVPKDENYMDYSEYNLLTGQGLLTRPVGFSVLVNNVPEKTIWVEILDVLDFILSTVILVICLWIPFLVIRILRSLKYSREFERKNLERINRIGLIVLAIGVVGSILRLVHVLIAGQVIELTHYAFSFSNVPDFNSFLIGVVILVMNEVLKISVAMSEGQRAVW